MLRRQTPRIVSGTVDETRAARNGVIVASANKLARISWAVLSSGNNYRSMHATVVGSN